MGAAIARFTIRFVVALVLAGALVAAGVVAVNSTVDKELDRIPRVDVQTAPSPVGGANYLVVGSDSRQFIESDDQADAFGDPSKETGRRSDTMMVVHVEPAAASTLVVSFPRDLWVNIPGYQNSKINAAYNTDPPINGGPNTIVETLKANFDVDVNHYVEVDFETFEEMVNAIGSVPVYVDRPSVDEVTGFLAAKAGCYHLNGPEALAWVRARSLKYLNPVTRRMVEDPTADIGRITRQQDFISRLLGSVVEESLANPLKGRDIVHDVVEDLRVDRGFDKAAAFDLVEAFRNVSSADTSALEFVTFPFTEDNAGGQAVLIPNDSEAEPLLERLRTFDTDPVASAPVVAPSDVRVEVRNGSGVEGLASETMTALVAAGFLKGGTGNDERGRVSTTEVRYATGAQDQARLVLDYVGKSAKLVGDPSLRTADVVVVLGVDFDGIEVPGASASASTPASSGAATGPTDADLAASCR